MIHSISANQPSFHRVEFTAGLNVVLADRTETSSQKDSRNGLGKSTLIEILDFCLGSKPKKGKGISIEPLKEWAFTLDLTLADQRVKVTRAVAAPNRIMIDGPTAGWIEQPDTDKDTGEYILNADRWRTLLGWALFGLPCTNDIVKYKPTYRSLVSYFVRRGPDAYSDPFRHFRQQKTWDIQVNIDYLLGLNWEYASQWQMLKDQEEAVKAVDQAIKTGVLEGTLGSVGKLETERVQLEQQVVAEEKGLKSFKVHPQYEAVQADADRITSEIHKLANQNVVDRRRFSQYRQSIGTEKPPSDIELDKLYEETGLVFPEAVQRTLAEAKAFHQGIVKNRKAFLATEIARLERKIQYRDERVRELTQTRASSLEILKTHGALEEMTRLQDRYVETKGRLDRISSRIREMKDLTTRKRELKVAKTELAKVAELDHEQRRDLWSFAVRLFNENSQALYETPGRLVIDIGDTGYKFLVEIERSDSEGVGKMKVFCFDLMLLQLSEKLSRRVDFLVHDSALYDGVDSRQRALAIEHAAKVCEEIKCQYICALNSDMVPSDDFSDEFDFSKHVRLTLTDKTPSDSLLGFRY